MTTRKPITEPAISPDTDFANLITSKHDQAISERQRLEGQRKTRQDTMLVNGRVWTPQRLRKWPLSAHRLASNRTLSTWPWLLSQWARMRFQRGLDWWWDNE